MFDSVDIKTWTEHKYRQQKKIGRVRTAQLPPPPQNCQGAIYQVAQGDSLFLIAQQFGVTLQQLIVANPQVRNPAVIYPGQMICVPVQRQITASCAVLLPVISQELAAALEPWAGGVARLVAPEPDYTVVTVSATGLPEPSTFGAFDGYLGNLRQQRGTQVQQYSTILTLGAGNAEMPATWAGSRRVPGLLEAQDEISVRPHNTATGAVGEIIFASDLAGC